MKYRISPYKVQSGFLDYTGKFINIFQQRKQILNEKQIEIYA